MAYTDLTSTFIYKKLLSYQNMDALAENDAYFYAGIRVSNGNVGIGTPTFDGTGVSVLTIKNGTAPAAHVDDEVQIFSTDISGGDATLGLYTEVAVAAETDETKFSHKLPVKINGSTYYIMLTAT